jgi:hypothetical protein
MSSDSGGLANILTQIAQDEWLRIRAAQHAISQALAWQWEWRAEQFHNAAPKDGDYTGEATPAQLEEARTRCHSIAQACQNKAALIRQETE